MSTVTDTCEVWTGRRNANGYGVVKVGRQDRLAHRVAYQTQVGPVPAGLELDHLCRNRACVNVAHLEPVTHRENVLRGASLVAEKARQTHCIHGHEFTPENTWIRPDRGTRTCRTCNRITARAQYAKRKAAKS